jgi:hypothetical protein
MAPRVSAQELERLGFIRAGAIEPENAGQGCRLVLQPDVTGCIVYAHVVVDEVKKFGSTSPSLRARMGQNASTIRTILEFQSGRPVRPTKWHTAKWDKFKLQAPAVIRGGNAIDIWATRLDSMGKCGDLEGELNGRYETLIHGWATRLR